MAKKNLVYNLSRPVGPKMANEPDDVLLVRFFLRKVSEVPEFASPFKNLPIVTTFDSTLGEAIWWYQKLVRSSGKPITVDGQIHPAPKGDGIYTILHLNATYWKHFPKFKHYVEGDPLFPSQLIEPFNSAKPYYV